MNNHIELTKNMKKRIRVQTRYDPIQKLCDQLLSKHKIQKNVEQTALKFDLKPIRNYEIIVFKLCKIESHLMNEGWSSSAALQYIFDYIRSNLDQVLHSTYSRTNPKIFVQKTKEKNLNDIKILQRFLSLQYEQLHLALDLLEFLYSSDHVSKQKITQCKENIFKTMYFSRELFQK